MRNPRLMAVCDELERRKFFRNSYEICLSSLVLEITIQAGEYDYYGVLYITHGGNGYEYFMLNPHTQKKIGPVAMDCSAAEFADAITALDFSGLKS